MMSFMPIFMPKIHRFRIIYFCDTRFFHRSIPFIINKLIILNASSLIPLIESILCACHKNRGYHEKLSFFCRRYSSSFPIRKAILSSLYSMENPNKKRKASLAKSFSIPCSYLQKSSQSSYIIRFVIRVRE